MSAGHPFPASDDLPASWLGWPRRRTAQAVLVHLVPLLTVVMFTLVMLGAYLYLRKEERAREVQTLEQRSQFLALRLSELLLTKQDDIQRLANDMTQESGYFDMGARSLMANDSSLYALSLMDIYHRVVATHHSSLLPGRLREGSQAWGREETAVFSKGRWELVAAGKDAQSGHERPAMLRFLAPLQTQDLSLGAVVAEYSPQSLLSSLLHQDGSDALVVSLVDAHGQRIAGMGQSQSHDALGSRLPQRALTVTPLGDQVQLLATLYRSDRSHVGDALFILMMLLGLATTIMLIVNWRLNYRRADVQRRLRAESNFRRAIENALTTGIRVLDMDGTTTYTNVAFSRMVGWSQRELEGMQAPFPYWPLKDRDVLMERFRAELSGQHYPNGLQLRMRRKNGTAFDARVHMVPLLDAQGVQHGWLSAITDITEPNRIRQQLTVAHERFTLVLEAMDASISVAPLGSGELVFANGMYRQWFGSESQGHMQMLAGASASQASADIDSELGGDINMGLGDADDEDALMGLPAHSLTGADSERAEVFMEPLGKWLEVRSRYLDWVDGRLAQMLIATDITARKHTEEQAARQAEHAQNVSRLVTMGEMASSVAHELNQPLAAISNYTNGMLSRIRAGSIAMVDLITPLEKTAHQAMRAGQVIERIRSFVKRNESSREACSPYRLVSESVELANIEIRKRKARLNVQLDPHLPQLEVDAILIEQVLINLMKNAAEAMDGAGVPESSRVIDLRLNLVREPGQRPGVRFTVADRGPGLPEEALRHLFDAFYSTKSDGMGIGLNLCRSIVEAHHGQLKVRNLYNVAPQPQDGSEAAQAQVSGCEFSFWLPAAQPLAQESENEAGPILG